MSAPQEWIFSSCPKFPSKNMAWLSFIQDFLGSLRCIVHFFSHRYCTLMKSLPSYFIFYCYLNRFFFFSFDFYDTHRGQACWVTVSLVVADRGEPLWRVVWCLSSILKKHSPFIQQPHHWVLENILFVYFWIYLEMVLCDLHYFNILW